MVTLMLASILLLLSAPSVHPVTLPGGPPVSMDYLAWDAAHGRVWIPAGNTGRVYVLDARSGKLDSVEGFPTAKRGERTVGPSSATAGENYVYVGNRADSSVCAVEAKTLSRKGCVTLASMPDGLQYVAPTKEVWVTTPRDKSIVVLSVKDPAAPAVAGKIDLDGQPEGFAVDAGRALFFTNLEDKDRTLAIDARSRKVLFNWKTGCGEAGPRGLAVDTGRQHLYVACTDRVKLLDERDGKVLSELETGGGVDNIDYLPAKKQVYVASGTTGTLSIVEDAADGSLKRAASVPTAPGGRTALVDSDGTVYIPDSKEGRLLVVKP